MAGRKSIDFFRRRHWKIRQQWGGVFDRLSFEHALDIGQNIVSQYHEGIFDQLICVIYNKFKSVMQQQVIVEKLLPIESVQGSGEREKSETVGGYLYEPDENESLETLFPKHFEIQTYRVLLESAAAEQANG